MQKLEISFTSLRAEKTRLERAFQRAEAEASSAGEARGVAQSEVARLASEVRGLEAELTRVKEGERDAREARRQMAEISERRVSAPHCSPHRPTPKPYPAL